MKTYISNYFCFIDIRLGQYNITDIYYYSGVLIKKSHKNKAFDALPADSQLKIFTKLSSLNDLGRKNWNTGYDGNKYYVISSENKLEIFEVMFDGITPQDIFMRLDEQAFDEEVIKLQNTAVCIFQEQYFRNMKYKKEKLYPKPDIL